MSSATVAATAADGPLSPATIRRTCFGCRVVGSAVPLGVSGYMAYLGAMTPSSARPQKLVFLATAAAFAALGATQAVSTPQYKYDDGYH